MISIFIFSRFFWDWFFFYIRLRFFVLFWCMVRLVNDCITGNTISHTISTTITCTAIFKQKVIIVIKKNTIKRDQNKGCYRVLLLYFYCALEIGVNLGQVIPDKILAKYLLTFFVQCRQHTRERDRERKRDRDRERER